MEHISSDNIWKQMQTGLVYNTADKYRLNKIFGQQEGMTNSFYFMLN
jgi:hypothetical protein